MLASNSIDPKYLFLLIPVISFLGTYTLVPVAELIGDKYQLKDIPNLRKLHTQSLVRIGGVPIFVGFVLGLLSVLFTGYFENISIENISIYGRILIITSSSIFLLGLLDDLLNLSPRFRLFFQFVIASITWVTNLRIESLDLSFLYSNLNSLVLPNAISYLITVIWIVGIINAINWMDGADGLATGLIIIASFSFLVVELSNNVLYVSCILVSLIGSAIAFLIFNYNPAKILMGDCGSYFFGFNLAILSFISSSDSSTALDIRTVLLILFIPLMDMVYVIFNRLKKGKSPFNPDKTHLHHRLLESGLSQKETVKIIWGLAIVLSILALVLKGIVAPVFIFYSFILYIISDVRIKRFLKRILLS